MWEWIEIVVGLICIGTAIYFLLQLLKAVPENKGVPEITSIQEKDPTFKSSRLKEQIEKLQQGSNTDNGRVTEWWEKGKSESRTKTDLARTDEAAAKVELNTVITGVYTSEVAIQTAEHSLQENKARLERAVELEKSTHEQTMMLRANEEQVIQKATNKGLHAPTYLKTEEKRQLDELEANVKDKDTDREIRKHKEIEGFNVQMDLQEKLNTLSAILEYKRIRHIEFDENAKRLIKLIEEEKKIKDEPYKEEELKVIREQKATYQRLFQKDQQRLLETGDGEVISGLDSLSDLIGSGEDSNPEPSVKIPVKRTGGGKRKNIPK
jgi:hypothetical protein